MTENGSIALQCLRNVVANIKTAVTSSTSVLPIVQAESPNAKIDRIDCQPP